MVTMKIGISMGGFPMATEAVNIGPLLSRSARRADEAGFDSLWTMDHFFQIPITGQPPEAPLLEAYAVLAFLAAETERIRLGTMVMRRLPPPRRPQAALGRSHSRPGSSDGAGRSCHPQRRLGRRQPKAATIILGDEIVTMTRRASLRWKTNHDA
jgi:hypothetical protein